jgi:hypothetical protein
VQEQRKIPQHSHARADNYTVKKGYRFFRPQTDVTLQRQKTEILKQIIPEKEYRGLSPNFHIHVSVSDLYIPTIGLPILLEEICRPILGLYRSQTHECGNWGRAIPRKGIHQWDFPCSALSKLSLAGNILIIPGQGKLG